MEFEDFGSFLASLRGGSADQEALEELHRVAEAVDRTGSKGTVTLVAELSQASRGQLLIGAKVSSKEPKPVSEETMFFVGERGKLSRRNPGQRRMDFDRATGEEN